ncbi:Crp/Fnr family transcriptional regulator [Methylobacterium sp. CM6247]
MSQPQQSVVQNLLLKRLSPDDFALLQPNFQPLRTTLHQTLIWPHDSVTHLLFPESGYVSIIGENAGGKIEVGMIGREGLVGASVVLHDAGTTPYQEFVQCPGEMLVIEAGAFCCAVDHSPTLRRLMLRYVQTKLIQARQIAFVNAAYHMDVRLARWLLMCHDRADSDEIPVTHEFIALMLGVQRAGATITVQTLEGTGTIKAKRGRITICDREGLVALADGSYGTAEAGYARLIEGA